MNCDTNIFYLGNLCVHSHSYEDTDKSLRYKSNNICVECKKASTLKYETNNKEKVQESHKNYILNNPEKRRKSVKKYDDNHKPEKKEYNIEYQKNLSNEKRNQRKLYQEVYWLIYYTKNKETIKKQKQLPEVKIKTNERERKRRQANPGYKLSSNFSNIVRFSLKGNKQGYHWETLVEYTIQDLKEHLEEYFTEDMSWINYGIYWEIDHIIPISYFEFKSFEDEEFKLAWNLSNLQPLEKSQNRKKYCNFIGNFNKKMLSLNDFIELADLFPIKMLCQTIWKEYVFQTYESLETLSEENTNK